MLAIERLGGTVRRGIGLELVPPVIAARRPVDVSTGAAVDDHVLERRAQIGGGVGVFLEWNELAAAIAAIGGEQHLGLAVLNPSRQRLGAEAAEDHRMRRPDPAHRPAARSPAREPAAYKRRRRRLF